MTINNETCQKSFSEGSNLSTVSVFSAANLHWPIFHSFYCDYHHFSHVQCGLHFKMKNMLMRYHWLGIKVFVTFLFLPIHFMLSHKCRF